MVEIDGVLETHGGWPDAFLNGAGVQPTLTEEELKRAGARYPHTAAFLHNHRKEQAQREQERKDSGSKKVSE